MMSFVTNVPTSSQKAPTPVHLQDSQDADGCSEALRAFTTWSADLFMSLARSLQAAFSFLDAFRQLIIA